MNKNATENNNVFDLKRSIRDRSSHIIDDILYSKIPEEVVKRNNIEMITTKINDSNGRNFVNFIDDFEDDNYDFTH